MKIALSEREVPIREGSSYRESTVFCGCYGNSFAHITNMGCCRAANYISDSFRSCENPIPSSA